MPSFDGYQSLDTRGSALLEQENARLTATLRRVRRCLEEAELDPDADAEALREALHEARRAAADGDRMSRA
jgi:hypothetical protein